MNYNKHSTFLLLGMLFLLSACSTTTTQTKIQTRTRTIIKTEYVPIINTVTEKYEETRVAKLPKYKINSKYYSAIGQDERVRFLILHYTAMENEPSLRVLTQKEVSAHYLVNDIADDSIYLLVNENKRAWHAGVSKWKGIDNLNFSSIGIEIVNLGYDEAINEESGKIFYPFPYYQIDKVAELAKNIINRYNIDPVNVLAHSDIAPQRKHDPGPLFPWKELYTKHNIGAWYEEDDKNIFLIEYPYSEVYTYSFIADVQREFQKYGYEISITGEWDEQTKRVITVFQYHFRPALYDGFVDMETWAILKALNKKYRSN